MLSYYRLAKLLQLTAADYIYKLLTHPSAAKSNCRLLSEILVRAPLKMRPLTSSMIRVCTIYRSSAQFRLSSAEPLKRPLLVSEGAATYPVLWSSAAAKTRFIVCSIRTSSARRIDDITLGACLSTPTLHACLQFVRSILFRQMDGRRRSPLYLNLAATTDDFPFDAKIFVDSRRNHPATRPSKINQ